MNTFFEALLGKDHGFTFDPETDCLVYKFGEDYELWLEPISSNQLYLALYQRRLLVWPEKIPIRPGYLIPEGPGVEQEARRQSIRELLEAALAALSKADHDAIIT